MDEIRQLQTLSEIESAVQMCADDLFDQSNDIRHKLSELAKKFAKYADVEAIYDTEELAGYVAFYCNNSESKTGYISIIVVKKEYHGKGYGSLLYNKVIEILRLKNFHSLQLEVAKQNQNAINFYQHKGFTILKEQESSYILSKEISNN